MTDEELMALSRAYNENKKAIIALIVRQLRQRKPQAWIARDFGLEKSTICHRAKSLGISYQKQNRKG